MRGREVAEVVRPAATQRHNMVRRDALARLDGLTAAEAHGAIDHDMIYQRATIPLILSIVTARLARWLRPGMPGPA